MVTVYDVETGEPVECEPVDAKELVESGAYKAKQEEEKPKRGRKAKPEE